ncbi:MAG: type III-B CRISPR module-associated protein Cmr5 [Lachnospiraceae bacterium]|nr:type III-B CRISPR module-associated protein Cmr5 [Lachnospiraceae bacterium]
MSSNYLDRAKFAYAEINAYKKKHAAEASGKGGESESLKYQSKLRSYAKSVPSYIKTNGLLATMAFIDTKKIKKREANKNKQSENNYDGEAYQCLYDLIAGWSVQTVLARYKNPKAGTGASAGYFKSDFSNMTEVLANLSVSEYKNTEREILNLFCWVRRFAEGELEGGSEEE